MLLNLSICGLLAVICFAEKDTIPTSETKEPSIPKIQVDCSTRPDGFYTRGCNEYFVRCHKNKAYNHECPSGLFFDAMRRKCNYRDKIRECAIGQHEFDDVLIKSPDEFTCAGKEDKSYAHPEVPCDNQYYTCSHGNSFVQMCPYEQYFDEVRNTCDYKERVKSCTLNNPIKGTHKISGYAASVGEPVAPAAQSSYSASQSEPEAPAPPTSTEENSNYQGSYEITNPQSEPSAPSCSRSDGVYADKSNQCSNHFWKCANGKLFKYRCPANLWYDDGVDKCNHREFVPACGGVRPSTTEAPLNDPISADFDCTGKADDYYVKESCPSSFYHCNGGFSRKLECDNGLVYDLRINACDYPLACKAERKSQPNMLEAEDYTTEKPEEVKIDFDCSNKADGSYAIQKCFGKYIQCSEKAHHVMQCPDDLVFNENMNNCDFLQRCMTSESATAAADSTSSNYASSSSYVQTTAAAPAMPTVTEAPATSYQKDYPKKPYGKPSTSTTRKPASPLPQADLISCEGLTNGAHAAAQCSEFHVECWNGAATNVKCPDGLFFNAYNGECDYKSRVPGCNPDMDISEFFTSTTAATTASETTSKTIIQPADNYSSSKKVSSGYGSELPPVPSKNDQPQKPKEIIEPFCERLADGFYGKGCQNFFYSCHSQRTFKMHCPSDLMYDVDRKECDHKTTIPACGGVAPAAAAPSYSSETTVAPTTTAQAYLPYKKPVRAAAQFECTGRPDGLYALRECSTTYVNCFSGMSVVSNCRGGLYFNEGNGMCDYKEHVVACGGKMQVAASEPERKKLNTDYSCVGKQNGYYSKGCSATYYSCISEVVEEMTCPSNLRFSADLKRCDFPLSVVECGGSMVPIGAGAAPSQPEVSEGYGNQRNTVADVPAVKKPDVITATFSCVDKADGLYEVRACSPLFAHCAASYSIVSSCQSPLIYNEVSGKCDFAELVPSCKPALSTASKTSTMKNQYGVASDHLQIPEPLVPAGTTVTPMQQNTFSCTGMRDGVYALGRCSAAFIQCSNQQVFVKQCPRGTVLNKETVMCDRRERVVGCAAANSAPAGPCVGKSDGNYGKHCANRFITCTAGKASHFGCPAGSLFSSIRGGCDYVANLPVCAASINQ